MCRVKATVASRLSLLLGNEKAVGISAVSTVETILAWEHSDFRSKCQQELIRTVVSVCVRSTLATCLALASINNLSLCYDICAQLL